MSVKFSSLSKRLANFERRLASQARREERVLCECEDFTLADTRRPEQFEAEMNHPCRVHVFRQLGKITRVVYVNLDGTDEDSSKLDRLLAEYDARQLRSVSPELSHAPEKL